MTTDRSPETAATGNRWDLLGPPGTSPPGDVSVCIPCRNGGRSLLRTLRMLELQTVEPTGFEVVVADDGSRPPLRLDPAAYAYPLRVVRQEVDGFGAGRARNLAAAAASGDVLVFLDADVVPAPDVIELYAGWLARSRLCVPFGFSRFVELDDVDDDELARALIAGRVDELIGAAAVGSQEYREPYLELTRDLRVDRTDIFRTFVAATFAVSADLFSEVGGFRELGVRGVEDTELGYRLVNEGAFLVPVREANHWHQGRRTMSGAQLDEIRRARQPYVERLLPVGGFRPRGACLDHDVTVVPRFVAHVAPADRGGGRAVASIGASPSPDVQLVAHDLPEQRHAFADVWLPAEVTWGHETAQRLIDRFDDHGVGTLVLVGRHHAPVVARRRRATNRARRLTGEVRSDELADRLFGVAVVLAADADLFHGEGISPWRQRLHSLVGERWRRLRRLLRRVSRSSRPATQVLRS